MDHVLVVDDEETVRSVMKDSLEYFGYKVTVACNGKDGWVCFSKSDDFKLVITDIVMPFMDGIEFAKLIRNSDKPDTPIIAISAYFDKMKSEKGLFNSIMSKPVNLKALKNVIELNLQS